jgi:hypothetical protein
MTTIRKQTFIVAGKKWKTHNAIQIHQKKHIFPPSAHRSLSHMPSTLGPESPLVKPIQRPERSFKPDLKPSFQDAILSQSLSIIIGM